MRGEQLRAALAGLLLAVVVYGLVGLVGLGLGSGAYVTIEVVKAWLAS